MPNLATSINKIRSLEDLSEGATVIHRLHPMVKMITTIVFLVVVISFNKYNISGLMPFFVYPILLMALGEIPYKSVLSRLLIALPFSFFAGLANPFLDRELAFFLFGVPVSWGLLSFLSILLKTVLTVMAVLILVAATPMDQLARQLIRIKVPKIFVMQLMLTYRYLTLLITEAAGMMTAYHLRSKGQKGIQISHIGTFMGQLLLRSFDRAERVYFAMKCRGFNGEYQFAAADKMRPGDVIYMFLLCLAFLLLRWFNTSMIIGSLFGV
ncbi:MAG TPA: cobalt ECF transporter T component CbiQ [Anaerovoracaceae bacterium]|nr:cobalt ECF transporter T component CbiQ [Anaerovoracaceae bacterium]